MSKRYLITSALPYANGPAHIGHIAGAYLPADIFVRYLRAKGEDVVWVCGSDEHGAAITLRAKKEGISPQEIVDKYHGIIKKSMDEFGISFDIYSRTSNEIHKETAQDFFKVLNDQGSFEVKTSEQYYDEEEKQFLADRYITGRCPNCQSEGAYGDQCEKCGKDLSPTDLINPKSTISGNSPVLKETSLWYLPMGNHEDWLKEYLYHGMLDGKKHHDVKEWKNHVIGQCKSWLEAGLHSRAMTRDLDWGIPVPVEGAEGKVLYVWLDAPIGYISATKEWAEANGKNWEDYWKDKDTELINFIGKDNIVFHSIIFPIILKEYGGYNLPSNVPANEFMNLEGDKISTSRNWAVWLHEYLADFPGKQDELRYVLTSLMPEQKDSEFTWDEYQKRINNELADIVGNFYNRAFVLTKKYYQGAIPAAGVLTNEDQLVLDELRQYPTKIGASIERFRFKEALGEMMNLARLGNKYLADSEPWKLVKTDADRVKTIMNITLQIAANLAFVMEPFLPFSTEKIVSALNLSKRAWNSLGGTILEDNHLIDPLPILFTKIEDTTVAAQQEKLMASKKDIRVVEPPKENIAFEDFTKLDIRIATILQAEKIKKTKKLLKLLVDTGIDQRTVVSGIAEHYSPEDIIGKKVSLIVNLAPRKIKGVESQGMILMAENSNEELSFISPEKDTSNPGDQVS